MQTDFSVDIDNNSNSPIIRITGEVDVHSCPQLNKVLGEVIESGNKTLLLNLDGVQYMDSTGLGSIAHTAKQIAEDNGNILLVCNKPQIKKIFEISGLSKKNITLFESEERALSTLS